MAVASTLAVHQPILACLSRRPPHASDEGSNSNKEYKGSNSNKQYITAARGHGCSKLESPIHVLFLNPPMNTAPRRPPMPPAKPAVAPLHVRLPPARGERWLRRQKRRHSHLVHVLLT
jgi:hypothetical protein